MVWRILEFACFKMTFQPEIAYLILSTKDGVVLRIPCMYTQVKSITIWALQCSLSCRVRMNWRIQMFSVLTRWQAATAATENSLQVKTALSEYNCTSCLGIVEVNVMLVTSFSFINAPFCLGCSMVASHREVPAWITGQRTWDMLLTKWHQ